MRVSVGPRSWAGVGASMMSGVAMGEGACVGCITARWCHHDPWNVSVGGCWMGGRDCMHVGVQNKVGMTLIPHTFNYIGAWFLVSQDGTY